MTHQLAHPRDYAIEVVNAADELIFRLTFSEALDKRIPRFTRRLRQ